MGEYIYRSENGDLLANSKGEISIPRERVIRCRNCKRFIPQGTYSFNGGVINKDSCEVIRGFVVQIDPNGFCAWGEEYEAVNDA